MPLIQLIIYGYAVNLDIKHIPLCVYDRDATQTSQDLLKRFQATDYFNIVRVSPRATLTLCGTSTTAPARWPWWFRRNSPRNFAPSGQASVQALLDASDSNTANIGMGYALSIVQSLLAAKSSSIGSERHGMAAVPSRR